MESALNSISPALDTAWENDTYKPTTGTPYQEVSILFAAPENVEYGAGYRESGYMQVMLKYPLKKGSKDATDRAELIRTTFKRGNSFTHGGVATIVSNTPEIGPGGVEDGRFVIPVRVRFFANVN